MKNIFRGNVRKGGGGGPPQTRNLFLAKILSVKGGWGTPLTDKIRKVVFDVLPEQILQTSFFFVKGRVKDGRFFSKNRQKMGEKTGKIQFFIKENYNVILN